MILSIFISDLSKILPRDNSSNFIEQCKTIKPEQRELFLHITKVDLVDFEEVFKVIQLIEQLTFETAYYYDDFLDQIKYLLYLLDYVRFSDKNIQHIDLPDFNKKPLYYIDEKGKFFRTQ